MVPFELICCLPQIEYPSTLEAYQSLSLPRLPFLKPLYHVHRPSAARRALSTAFVLVECRQSRYHADNTSILVHDNDGGSPEARLVALKGIKVHQLIVADTLRQDWRR